MSAHEQKLLNQWEFAEYIGSRLRPFFGFLMDKYKLHKRVKEQLEYDASAALETEEGRLFFGVIMQSISDVLGLYKADIEKVYISNSGKSREKRKFVTQQQAAMNWFVSKEHYTFCKLTGLDCLSVDKLLEECGVKI